MMRLEWWWEFLPHSLVEVEEAGEEGGEEGGGSCGVNHVTE
jgi:hypothetical protein